MPPYLIDLPGWGPKEVEAMAMIDVGNQQLSYEDFGGGGPVIVFSHCFGMNRSMFGPQLEVLKTRYRCVTWDQRAHGGSYTDRPFTFWDSAKDCLALLDHLGIKQASFVGASQGGFVTLRLALTAPDRVRSLVVLGTSAAAESPEKKAAILQMQDALRDGEEPPRAILDALAYICFGSNFDPTHWQAIWRKWPAKQARLANHALVERDDLSGRLVEISVPALVLHGTSDNSYAVSDGQAIADGIARSEPLVQVKGGAHFLSVTHPEPVNSALSPFLAKYA
jgi:3-oxoadipate enol-lactonase